MNSIILRITPGTVIWSEEYRLILPLLYHNKRMRIKIPNGIAPLVISDLNNYLITGTFSLEKGVLTILAETMEMSQKDQGIVNIHFDGSICAIGKVSSQRAYCIFETGNHEYFPCFVSHCFDLNNSHDLLGAKIQETSKITLYQGNIAVFQVTL